MGQFDFTQIDHRASGYIQDKWQVNNRLTLNLGVRYDWQELDARTRRTRSVRASASPTTLTGDGKTLIRGGFGKVYQYQQLAILADAAAADGDRADARLRHGAGDVAGDHRHVPGGAGNANATACLNPVAGPTPGEAVISPACRAFLNSQRSAGPGRRRRQQHDHRAARRRRSPDGVHLGVQRRRQARADATTWRCRSTTSATAGATTPASSTSTKGRSIRRPAASRGSA